MNDKPYTYESYSQETFRSVGMADQINNHINKQIKNWKVIRRKNIYIIVLIIKICTRIGTWS